MSKFAYDTDHDLHVAQTLLNFAQRRKEVRAVELVRLANRAGKLVVDLARRNILNINAKRLDVCVQRHQLQRRIVGGGGWRRGAPRIGGVLAA